MAIKLINQIDYDASKSDFFSGTTLTGIHHFGFDPDTKFQTIAVGTARVLSTVGGNIAGMSVSVGNKDICKINGTPDFTAVFNGRTGIFVIEGVSEGDTDFSLLDGAGKEVDKITIHVTKSRIVNVRYYNVVDTHGGAVKDPDHDAKYSTGALDKLTDAVNEIVFSQCDVRLVPTSLVIRDIVFHESLGGEVDVVKASFFKGDGKDPGAQYHVGFVWGIESLKHQHTRGITHADQTLLVTSLSEEHRMFTMAHELVHFLSSTASVKFTSHDALKSDLMFDTFPHGVNMRKERLSRIIH